MTEKILIVDDDPDILDVLILILESKGYRVVTARNGVEGLAKVEAEKSYTEERAIIRSKIDNILDRLEDMSEA